jgi:copper chaperone
VTTIVNHYHLRGVICQFCVRAVTHRVEDLPGVLGVSIDLDSGGMTVASSGWVPREEVAEAVRSAGYEVDR